MVPRMFVVACSGFPIAVSRYLNEFFAVEISDTEIGIPGMGTIRRWQREAPEGFVFTVLAPAEIGASGFAAGGATDQALKNILSFAKKLSALAIVFRVPEEVALKRPIATQVKAVLGGLPKGAPQAVLDAPFWPRAQVDKLCEATGAIAARPALELARAPDGTMAYLTMPGPAGFRSRYDDDALEEAAGVCRRSTSKTTVVVFRNIDMEANAKRMRALLGVD